MAQPQEPAMPPDDLSGAIAQFTPRLRAFAFSLVNDEAEAEDLVQETCLRAIGARDRFVPGTNLKAWLFTILRNLHRNRRRNLAARPRAVGFDDVAEDSLADDRPMSGVEHQAVARAEVDDVARVFRSLPPAFAVPLHLVAVEDLSYQQVAAILDIPIGTVMSRVYRARRLLMARLSGGT
jgi:RNA polymerase sigma-70 factor, ECF subfamily